MSPGEWEEFLREWVTGLQTEYVQVKRLAGSGDRGVDIGAFHTADGFEGSWDCFQAKHYKRPLSFTDAAIEIAKVFSHVANGDYTLPDSYRFMAPRSCSTQLNSLLSSPTALKQKFIAELDDGSKWGLESGMVDAISRLAASTSFAIFRSEELDDVLDVHQRTKYYVARFGGPLPPRPDPGTAPAVPEDHEERYISQLLEVYAQRLPDETLAPENLSEHPRIGRHFSQQRQRFFRAEALRLYARDSVPDGTFSALQADVHEGVIDVAESEFPSGFDRLTRVLTEVSKIDLSSHALISVANQQDRKGICHQLANDDKLQWMEEGL